MLVELTPVPVHNHRRLEHMTPELSAADRKQLRPEVERGEQSTSCRYRFSPTTKILFSQRGSDE
jgi:hypothetical protein